MGCIIHAGFMTEWMNEWIRGLECKSFAHSNDQFYVWSYESVKIIADEIIFTTSLVMRDTVHMFQKSAYFIVL